MEYTDAELAKAYVRARAEGKLPNHFVVINERHLNQLLADNSIVPSGKELIKRTTRKPVWIYQESSEEK